MRPLLSVVFISFKRVDLLTHAYMAFMRHNTFKPVELIVADDGSSPFEQQAIKQMRFDRYVLSSTNRRLGANNNAGLAAAQGKYILMMQDDWQMTSAGASAIERAINVLEADNEIGMVRFYGDPAPFPLSRREIEGAQYWVCDHHSPSYKPHPHIYTDTPHIRRRLLNAADVLGFYREGLAMEETEQEYAERFDRQQKYKIAFLHPRREELFLHLGDRRSFRATKLRYRLDAAALKLAKSMRLDQESALYVRLRRVWFYLRTVLIRCGVLP